MTRTLRVLMLEDNWTDAELIEEQLRRTGVKVITQRVDSAQTFASALREFAPDVVISTIRLRSSIPKQPSKCSGRCVPRLP